MVLAVRTGMVAMDDPGMRFARVAGADIPNSILGAKSSAPFLEEEVSSMPDNKCYNQSEYRIKQRN